MAKTDGGFPTGPPYQESVSNFRVPPTDPPGPQHHLTPACPALLVSCTGQAQLMNSRLHACPSVVNLLLVAQDQPNK